MAINLSDLAKSKNASREKSGNQNIKLGYVS